MALTITNIELVDKGIRPSGKYALYVAISFQGSGQLVATLEGTERDTGYIIPPFIIIDYPVSDPTGAGGVYTELIYLVAGDYTVCSRICNSISLGACRPPGDVYRKCINDTTIAVWNQVTCSYDSAPCSSGKVCRSGYCVDPLTISNVVVTEIVGKQGFADLSWTQNISGNVAILVDGTVISQGGYPAGNNSTVINGLSIGTHSVCVEGANKVCEPVTITSQVTCDTMTVDTWKPTVNKQESGKAIPIIVKSKDPNKSFLLYYDTNFGAGNQIVVSGTTDSLGCYTGEIPAQPDGEYLIKLCYPLLGICTGSTSPVTVSWGAKPIDLAQTAILAAGVIAVAYVLGSLLKRGD